MFFRWERAHAPPVETNGGRYASASEKRTRGRSASAQRRPGTPAKEPNSRQRRSAKRLLEFMRAKGTHESTTAAPATAGRLPQASTNRPEPGLRTPAAMDPKQRKQKTAAEDDGPKAADHAAVLYTAWKQDALAGSPAKSTEMETDEGSPKRARERSRDKRAPESGGSRSSCSCSSGHMSTDMTTPDSDTYAGRPRLEPTTVELPMGVMKGGKGCGGGKGKKGGKGRSRHR